MKINRNRFLKYIFILVIFGSIIYVHTSKVLGNENKNIVIDHHKITPEELTELKNQIGVYNGTQNTTNETGIIPPTEEDWDKYANYLYTVVNISMKNLSLPYVWDNSELDYFPPIGDQAGGSCACWSSVYYTKTFQEAKEHGWNVHDGDFNGMYGNPDDADKIFSPYFVFNQINDGTKGSSTLDAVDLMSNVGACSWENMPPKKVNGSNCDYDYSIWPNETAYRQAPIYRCESTEYSMPLTDDSDINSLKALLYSENLSTFTIDDADILNNLDDEVLTLDNYDETGDLTAHSVTIVGYDDNISYTENNNSNTKGAIKIANSWNDNWNDDGFAYISYGFVKEKIDTCQWYTNRYNYTPDLVAVFQMDHAKRGECEITIGLGSNNSSVFTKYLPQNGGSYPFSNFKTIIDITEFNDTIETPNSWDFFLKVNDKSDTDTTGNITYFSIEYYKNYSNSTMYGCTVSNDPPVQTINDQDVYADVELIVFSEDIGIQSMNYPLDDTYYCIGNYLINTTITNYGSKTWNNFTVNFSAYLDGVCRYTEEVNISKTLSHDQEVFVESPTQWNAKNEGNYSLIITIKDNDDYLTNNYRNYTVHIFNITDAGVSDIIYPVGGVQPNGTYNVSAIIFNNGTLNITNDIKVNCSIFNETYNLIWNETKTITDLVIYEDRCVNFSEWDASAGVYQINVSTELIGIEDENTDNNQKSLNITMMPTIVYVNTTYDDSTEGWQINNFSSIQNGTNAVYPTGTVQVFNGIYYEHNINVDETMDIVGENRFSTIIDGNNETSDIICIESDGNVTISGFTLRNSSGSGIKLNVLNDFSNDSISDMVIMNNSCGINLSLLVGQPINLQSYVNITNSIIQNNTYGVKCEDLDYNTFSLNTIQNNTYGIKFSDSINNLIYRNNFINNTFDFNDTGINFLNWENYSIGGNYWDEYDESSEGAWDNNSDNIVDEPYQVPGSDNIDHYPFIIPNGWTYNRSNYTLVTNFSKCWNFISLPLNNTIDKTNFYIYNDSNLTSWDTAVTSGYVSEYLFGWNRTIQSYDFANSITGGEGYWFYAYESGSIVVFNLTDTSDDFITNLKENWNIVGIPFDQSVSKYNLNVSYGNTNCSWSTAVTNGDISDYIFSWDRINQSYIFSDDFIPGDAYWLYSYQDCSLRINDGSENNDDLTNKKSWEITLFIETNNNTVTSDFVVLGESVDATDGLQNDFYEAPTPPANAGDSYLTIWSDDDLTSPYHQLSGDFRSWPDKEKTWNLTVSYISDMGSNTSVNLSWNKTLFMESEYNTMLLYDNTSNSTVNMLTQAYYQFNMTVNTTIDFQVLCNNGTLPVFENVTASPSTGGFGENITISAYVYHLFNNISMVKVNVTYPDNSTNNFTMANTENDTYQYGFDDTWQIGTYQYYLWATDTQGNSSYTTQYDFSIIANASIQVCTINNTYTSADDINVTDPPTPSTLYDIGYELLDDGDVLHMWNLYDSYYFYTDSGIQLTNHKDEYWSHNVLMLGYYNNDNWNLIYRTDELSGFQKTVDTDNQIFVNATLWKDLIYQGYEFRLAIRYHLGLTDNELTVIPYIENLGNSIPFTLGFAWEINDIRIDDTPENDYILINDSYYWLNESLDLSFKNLSKPVYCWNETLNESIICNYEPIPYFHIQENVSSNTVRSLYLRWDPDLNYKVRIQSQNDSYNAPIMLGIQIGTLDSGESKQTSLYWYDADQQVFYFDTNSPFETWSSNPGYMVDNNTATFATTSIENDVEKLTGNSCPEIDPGKISKVEIRAYAKYSGYACSLLLRPIFKYGDGDNHEYELTQTASWSDWYDITDDSNAPDWTWKDIETFDCDVEAYDFNILFSSTVYCAKVEIRATYSPWTPPSITNPTPGYGSTNVSIQPQLGITVSDDNSDELDISWLSNCSGSWQVFATNNSVGNGTYYQTMTGANVNGQWWYWMLNVSDDHDYNLSSVFKFYTGTQSKLVNTGSTTIKGYLLMQAEFWNGSAWIADQVVIDDTSPRYLNASGVLGLDTVFNGLLDTGDLHYGDGDYRVYAALCDPYGEVLEIDSEKLEAWWTFELDLI